METDSALLRMACERIGELAEPAFIKNSSLVHVAANEAYARLFGRTAREVVGRTCADLVGSEDAEWREKECRALVFGTDETARFNGEACAFRINIERFLTEDDRTFLFGTFETIVPDDDRLASVQPPKAVDAPSSPSLESALLNDALDMLDMGIGIYDRNDRLLYVNSQALIHFSSLSAEIRPGITLQEILGFAYDRREKEASGGANVRLPARQEWIAERMKPFRLPYWEGVDQSQDGRWFRSVNKRLENGILIAIRQDITDLKEQEMLLRSQEDDIALFRAVIDHLPVPLFVRDDGHRLTYANAAYADMLGVSPEEILGKTEAGMFPEDAERFRIENDRVIAGEDIDKTDDVVFPDGSVVPVITRKRLIHTADGRRYLVGSRNDVSLIKEAQNKAEKLSRDLQTILDALPVGVAILDEDLVFEYANPTFYALGDTGQPLVLPGLSYRDFLKRHFDDGRFADRALDFDAIYSERIAALTATAPQPPIEVRGIGGRHLVISGTPLSGGKLLLTYLDITAVRKQEQEAQEARRALERHGALMRDATSAMSQGLLILHDGAVVFSNDALPAMLDMPDEMFSSGAAWREIFRRCARRGDLGTAEQASAMLQAWEENVSAGREVHTSFRVNGARWIRIEANPTGSDHWLAVFTDVTDVVKREEELKGLLYRAEAADRAKSEFLANMSHEIRTPMNGVLGMAELLAKSPLDTRQKTFIDIIVKSGNALLTIINDILDFSKIDAGQMKLRKAPFDPAEAIEDVASLLTSSAAEKDIELIVRSDPSMREMVMGDAGRFRQIVTNLVGNAVKFTEKGHIFIDLGSRPVAKGKVMLSIRIEDTGVGIPEDQLRSIFEKFSQVDASSTRRHEGTGLGLAITAALTELFQGTIGVESKVGQGSVFTVDLPFEVARERKVQATLPVATRGARVLVVDDNPVNRRILEEQLSMWGFDTVAAEGGAEGLAILDECANLGLAVDAIVLDYHMPEMNGLAFARQLRNDPRFDRTGIVFLTSMDMAADDHVFDALNIQAHLMKPARANLLRSTIIEVVRTVRMKQAGESARAARLETTGGPDDQAGMQKGAVEAASHGVAAAAGIPVLDILVAEDNEVNQIVFRQILEATGWKFRIVSNGAEAVDCWRGLKPALILMDVSMPIMNGHEASRTIRRAELGTGSRTPIVGVTAHALEHDRELCLEAGMDDYLSKPISPEVLEAKISRWIGNSPPYRKRSSSSHN